MKYIRNNPINGIDYDYKLINKEFAKMLKKCKAPAGLYDPARIPFNDVKWTVLMSERSSSKTTQILLYCMMINKLYGVKSCYVKKRKEQITKSMYQLLFKVITDPVYGYIEYLTNGKYNTVQVTTDKFCYYIKTDEAGKITEVSNEPFMVLMSVDQYDRYMSSFNVPDYDFIIFDEFSWGTYAPDEFEHFCHLIQTVRRERESTRIILMSNTISPYNQHLRELGISSHVSKMHKSDYAIITSQLGARVYCELLNVGIHNTVEFSQKSLSYFGFENPALRSLYGGEWEIKGYRHLPPSKTRTVQPTVIILNYMGKNVRMETFTDGKQNGAVLTNYTKEIKPHHVIVSDTPVYTPDNTSMAHHNIIHKLNTLDALGLLYVSDNETGLLWSAVRDAILRK